MSNPIDTEALTARLLDRIAHEEAGAHARVYAGEPFDQVIPIHAAPPNRVLAVCKAHRAIVEALQRFDAEADQAGDLSHSERYISGMAAGLRVAVEELATLYALRT